MINVETVPITLEKATQLAKDAFSSATERDIYTGDYLQIYVIKRDGVTMQTFDLKKD